jgi:hypothetical protein
MRPLLFVAYVTGIIYSALRWEWVAFAAVGFFLLGMTLMIFLSIYRHFRVGGWF